jgi:putative flippase GtrA
MMPIALSNALSSVAGFTVVYLLATRYTFGVGKSRKTYIIFFSWYSFVIVFYSLLIEIEHTYLGWPPLVCKLVTIPMSFTGNYLFNRWLFIRKSSID